MKVIRTWSDDYQRERNIALAVALGTPCVDVGRRKCALCGPHHLGGTVPCVGGKYIPRPAPVWPYFLMGVCSTVFIALGALALLGLL